MKKVFTLALFLYAALLVKAQVTKVTDNGLWGFNVGSQVLLINRFDSSLWKIDASNSFPVQYSTKAKFSYDDSYIETSNNSLFLAGRTETNGSELWMTDGTDEGTLMIKDINPGVENSDIRLMAEINGLVFFRASTSEYGRELWVTDGTEIGTHIVKDIVPGSGGSGFGFEYIVKNNLLYFIVDDGLHGSELWKTDGTEIGTVIIKDINALPGGSSLINTEGQYLINTGQTILFTAFDGVNGYGLWKTDGTESGTEMIKLIDPKKDFDQSSSNFLFFKGKYFFNYQSQLWVTDQTTDGTLSVKDFKDVFANGGYVNITTALSFDDKFIFRVRDNDASGDELWSSDGTSLNTKLFFKTANYSNRGIYLLTPYSFYKNIPNHAFSNYIHTSPFAGKFFLYTIKSDTENELWVTNGVSTDLLKSKVKFDYNDYIDVMYYRFDSSGLTFSLLDSTNGVEPWISNGTVSGTALLADINPGIASSNPIFQFKYNNQQYFAADDNDDTDGIHSLFKIAGTLPVSLLSFTASVKNNNAELSWITATENNVSHFIIQRSKDGVNYADVGSITARNTGSQQQQYFFNDANVFAGVNTTFYYRLKTMDKDGKFSLSKIALLTKLGSNISIAVSPNPVKNLLTINYTAGNVQLNSMRITDANGHVIFVINNLPANSSGQQTVNVSKFAKGFYHVQLISGTEKKSVAFVKE